LLFDEAPKTSLADFFDFRDELGTFRNALRKGRRLVKATKERRIELERLVDACRGDRTRKRQIACRRDQ